MEVCVEQGPTKQLVLFLFDFHIHSGCQLHCFWWSNSYSQHTKQEQEAIHSKASQARHSGSARNKTLPAFDTLANPEGTLCSSCTRTLSDSSPGWVGVQVATGSHRVSSRSQRSLPSVPSLWRLPLFHPRQESHSHAQGHTTNTETQRPCILMDKFHFYQRTTQQARTCHSLL